MITEIEEKFVRKLVEKGFDKEEVIALSLVCRKRNIIEEMLLYMEENPNANFDSLLEKAVEGLKPLKVVVRGE